MSMNDLLTQLSQISSSLFLTASQDGFSTFAPDYNNLGFLLPFPDLALDVPSPDSLVGVLASAGIPSALARELSEIHANRAAELADHYCQTYSHTCLEISSIRDGTSADERMKMFLRLQQADRRLYNQTVASWADELQTLHPQFGASSNAAGSRAIDRNVFNSDFTPVLEAIFKKNRRPSPAMKRALAHESGMSIRQINVWFQNHRSRANKGSVNSDSSNSTGACEIMGQRSPGVGNVPPTKVNCDANVSDSETVLDDESDSGHSERKSISSRSSSYTLVDEEELDVLECKAPLYAFPTIYPPQVVEDPFPCRSRADFSFPKPIWSRTPSRTSSSVSVPDIPALAKAFSKLTFKNAAEKDNASEGKGVGVSCTRIPPKDTPVNGNAQCPFITRTYTAPLPFLIRRVCQPKSTCSSGTDGVSGNALGDSPPSGGVRDRESYFCRPSDKPTGGNPDVSFVVDQASPKGLTYTTPRKALSGRTLLRRRKLLHSSGSTGHPRPVATQALSPSAIGRSHTQATALEKPSPIVSSTNVSTVQVTPPSWGFEELFSNAFEPISFPLLV